MIALQMPAPPSLLIMVNPYVETDEAQRLVKAWVDATSLLKGTTASSNIEPSSGDWLSRAYALGTEGEDEDIVFDMMSSVNELLCADRFREVNDILAQLREGDVPLVVVEGLLRFCSRAQAHLDSWDDLKARLLAEAQRRGDTEEILFAP